MTVIYSHSPVILLLLLIYKTPVILKGVVKVSKYAISNNVKFTSSYSRLLCVQHICRFYEKTPQTIQQVLGTAKLTHSSTII